MQVVQNLDYYTFGFTYEVHFFPQTQIQLSPLLASQ